MKYLYIPSLILLLLLPFAFSENLAHFVEVGGYLPDTETEEYFTIYTELESLDIIFSYPDGADFRVIVRGEKGQKLGNFILSEGNIVNLSGGGYFSLIIYSVEGKGEWYAWAEKP
jgi:hypothetical protein